MRETFELRGNSEDRALPREELLAGIPGVDALLCIPADRVDAEVMDAAGPSLRVISNYAVGYDNVDVPAATARGILVTNTPGVLTETTADLAWALILGASRRVAEGDALVRSGDFHGIFPTFMLGAGCQREDPRHRGHGTHRHGGGPPGGRIRHVGSVHPPLGPAARGARAARGTVAAL